jgi:hypothetical protein
MKLSNHFWYNEFSDRDHAVLTPVQIHMVSHICNEILEPIRSYLSEVFLDEVKMRVVSGIRFPSDHNRLRKQGFNPSETSDHMYGNIVKLRNPIKIRRYGKYFQYSVGAVDIMPSCGAKEAWDVLLPKFDRDKSCINLINGPIEIGQVILEKRQSYWLHISNPKNLIYRQFVAENFLKREPFLMSNNNGKTYQPIIGG